jgi:HAD superfamily hydrolase (TIGR01490 family)
VLTPVWRAQAAARQSIAVEAAFFDLDKTIIARSGPLALGRSFFREGLISRSLLLKAAYAQLVFHLMGADEAKMERIRLQASRLTEGWDVERVREIVSEVLEEVISPLIYAEALELIHDHGAAGRLICIVSSSPEEVVEPLAGMLRIDTYLATRPRIVDGRYTGELDFYCYGSSKREAIRELATARDIDLEGSFAYSDSATDLPMLELVGNPVAVNPDRELRKIAMERGWRIESFKNPVTLRQRLPTIRPPKVPAIRPPKVPTLGRPALPTVRRPKVPQIRPPKVPALGRPALPTIRSPNVRTIRPPRVPAVGRPALRPVAAAGGLMGVAAVAWWAVKRTPAPETRRVLRKRSA